ncbi:MAG: hypothetical protein A2289_05940, partial [Deltaproteobacteria bacterium RIFOXYA12_FULL_58_15]
MAKDPELRTHEDWIGLLQPVGLVVSPPALLSASAVVDRNVKPFQDELRRLLGGVDAEKPRAPELIDLVTKILEWKPSDLVGDRKALKPLDVVLPDYDEVLSPSFAVAAPKDANASEWLMLVQVLPEGIDFDDTKAFADKKWQASAQSRLERLLWETEVPIGLSYNGQGLRLSYVPRGETSGYVTLPLDLMAQAQGRSVLGALRLLLGADRLFTLPTKQRLPAILSESRKYQNVVSTALADQVLTALIELVAGFQSADEYAKRRLLADVLREDPQSVYGGLLATLLRLVFILYAEDRGLLPDDAVYQEHYSVTRLFERLRADAALYPDTMDQRYGAWAQLLSLFRLIFDGAEYLDPNGKKPVRLPARQGDLFNPDVYPFLEGRPYRTLRVMGDRYTPPRVSDGVVWKVLQSLLVLDGQRLSYRALDVEQIGSVYEALMGFELRVAEGKSLAVRPKSGGKGSKADVVVNIEQLLDAKPKERVKLLLDEANCELGDKGKKDLEAAKTIEAVALAMTKKVSKRRSEVLPAGSMFLQPTEERRRSGSHYTPRSLTAPIVQKALEPIFAQLGKKPKPEQILELKVCDPAMGSGAFLVEACRQLSQKLVEAWTVHSCTPQVPPDEDPLLHARRIIAQRCLYGVDKNPFAVDLAKLSLWLATLARDHAFTFLDHNLRHGDSLVGLTRDQITAFNWEEKGVTLPAAAKRIKDRVDEAVRLRTELLAMGDSDNTTAKRHLLKDAEDALADARLMGDLVISAFFGAEKDKDRKSNRDKLAEAVTSWLNGKGDTRSLQAQADELREKRPAVVPFHWQVEFPEVFGRENPGFDCFVGNPPFAGRNTLLSSSPQGYLDWLKSIHRDSHGNSDLVAHFFRGVFEKLRSGGTFGLVATKTIGQGDTRTTGLRWICQNGGTIYGARRRYKWPGQAAVIVSLIWTSKGPLFGPFDLDGASRSTITAYLFHAGGHDNPDALVANTGLSSKGYDVYGLGFIFDDDDTEGVSSPVAEMHRLIKVDARNAERIFPYVGGEDLMRMPRLLPARYIINFGDLSEPEARRWPALMELVETKVRPQRLLNNRESYKRHWWQYAEKRPGMQAATRGLSRILATSRVANAFAFTFIPANWVMNEKVVVFAFDDEASFAVLQSRTHEVWARFFSATLKDDLQYALSDCFDTYPFPEGWRTRDALERIGSDYLGLRSEVL